MSLLSGSMLTVKDELAIPLSAWSEADSTLRDSIYAAANPREALLEHLAALAVTARCARPSLSRALVQRERLHPTGIPTAVPCALPHTDASHVLAPAIGVAVLPEPIEFTEMGSNNRSVMAEVVVMILVKNSLDQVDALQAILAVVGNAEAAVALRNAATPAGLAATFNSLVNGQ